MTAIAYLAGAMAGSLRDILVLAALAVALGLGGTGKHWLWPVGLAALLFVIRIGISQQNRRLLGLEAGFWPLLSGVAGVLLVLLGWGLGLFIRRAALRARRNR